MFENTTVKEMLQLMTTVRVVVLLNAGLEWKNSILVSNCIHQLAIRGDLDLIANSVNSFFETNEVDQEDPFMNCLATTLLEIKGFSPVLGRLGTYIRNGGSASSLRAYEKISNYLSEYYINQRAREASERRKLDLDKFYSSDLPKDRVLLAESIQRYLGNNSTRDFESMINEPPELKRIRPKNRSIGGPLTSEELDELRNEGLAD